MIDNPLTYHKIKRSFWIPLHPLFPSDLLPSLRQLPTMSTVLTGPLFLRWKDVDTYLLGDLMPTLRYEGPIKKKTVGVGYHSTKSHYSED